MKNIFFIFIFIFIFSPFVNGALKEKEYQKRWCAAKGGVMEVRMSDGTRCDCVTATHAIEFDFASKWAEAIGQSLNYAMQSGNKRAGIVIIYRDYSETTKFWKLKRIIQRYELPIDVWSIHGK